jgi:predicted O-methyltransferase YrrM
MSPAEPDVDQYLQQATYGEDPFAAFNDRARAGGLPEIQVAPVFGRLLEILTRLVNARVVVEVGTLGGYSAAWIARGLADGGRVYSMEIDAHHADVARENLSSVGLDDVVDVLVGPALDTFPTLAANTAVAGHVDLAFIDADKSNNPNYVNAVLDLMRVGGLIIVDNVVRGGSVLGADSTDPNVVGSRSVLELLGATPRLTATALQTVGFKGYDGFAVALVGP